MYQFDQIFQPKNIAIIGGGEWNEHVVNQCRKLNFSGELWSVHPKKSEFAGLTPYKTIADLPSAPDVSFIGVKSYLRIAQDDHFFGIGQVAEQVEVNVSLGL